jgi:required for meiotic nuclear division protein 1
MLASQDRTARPALAASGETMPVQAMLLGERLDIRAVDRDAPRPPAPLLVDIPGGGRAVLFRYGAVVLFGTASEAANRFAATLMPNVTAPFAVAERDEASLVIDPKAEQHVDAAGNILVRDGSPERLQLVADILAKSLILAHYEGRMADIFDRIEPLAATLRERGRAGAGGRVLLRHIGDVLLMQQQMVGRVETAETPELLWEHPELERLYMRLADEYELRERDRALDRKLDIVSRTVETLLSLVQTRSSLRVEWYIVVLIVAELLLSLYPLLLHR